MLKGLRDAGAYSAARYGEVGKTAFEKTFVHLLKQNKELQKFKDFHLTNEQLALFESNYKTEQDEEDFDLFFQALRKSLIEHLRLSRAKNSEEELSLWVKKLEEFASSNNIFYMDGMINGDIEDFMFKHHKNLYRQFVESNPRPIQYI
jgi:hypothetical protein